MSDGVRPDTFPGAHHVVVVGIGADNDGTVRPSERCSRSRVAVGLARWPGDSAYVRRSLPALARPLTAGEQTRQEAELLTGRGVGITALARLPVVSGLGHNMVVGEDQPSALSTCRNPRHDLARSRSADFTTLGNTLADTCSTDRSAPHSAAVWNPLPAWFSTCCDACPDQVRDCRRDRSPPPPMRHRRPSPPQRSRRPARPGSLARRR